MTIFCLCIDIDKIWIKIIFSRFDQMFKRVLAIDLFQIFVDIDKIWIKIIFSRFDQMFKRVLAIDLFQIFVSTQYPQYLKDEFDKILHMH